MWFGFRNLPIKCSVCTERFIGCGGSAITFEKDLTLWGIVG